ncbi:hypothetical protein CN645_31440 [Burkholderia sp. IDO3]|nr:hypothetical protein CN645_31440 [Burkholderia sp. IDO3]
MPCGRSSQEKIGNAVRGNLAPSTAVEHGRAGHRHRDAADRVMVALVLRPDWPGSEMLRFAQPALARTFVSST